jgi:hypothetical protein
MKLPLFLLPFDHGRKAYAYLYDLVFEPGSKAYSQTYAKGLTEWKTERDPRMRRIKWCLNILHSQEELEEMVLDRLKSYDLGDIPAQPMEASGGSVAEHDADLCDVVIFSDLNISYGERIGVGRFDDLDEAENLANGQERSTSPYSDGHGGYYVVYDPDLSD